MSHFYINSSGGCIGPISWRNQVEDWSGSFCITWRWFFMEVGGEFIGDPEWYEY